MTAPNYRGEKFRIVSQPATEAWCGDCDENPSEDFDGTIESCMNQPDSAMIELVGAEEDGEFAICKRHLEWMKSQGAIIS